ncbi:MAG: hypothetical protein ACXU86_10785 [Archangium sp.]
MSIEHLLAPPRLRRVLERFTDWRGEMVRLECGHIIRHDPKTKGKRRQCRPCQRSGRGGLVPALHDFRCGCAPCMGRE